MRILIAVLIVAVLCATLAHGSDALERLPESSMIVLSQEWPTWHITYFRTPIVIEGDAAEAYNYDGNLWEWNSTDRKYYSRTGQRMTFSQDGCYTHEINGPQGWTIVAQGRYTETRLY